MVSYLTESMEDALIEEATAFLSGFQSNGPRDILTCFDLL
jgi:hypothetical protein